SVWNLTANPTDGPVVRANAFTAVRAAAYHPNGRTIALGMEGGWLYLRDTGTGTGRQALLHMPGSRGGPLMAEHHWLTSAAFSPAGAGVAGGGAGGVRLGATAGRQRDLAREKDPPPARASPPDRKPRATATRGGADGGPPGGPLPAPPPAGPGEVKLWDVA